MEHNGHPTADVQEDWTMIDHAQFGCACSDKSHDAGSDAQSDANTDSGRSSSVHESEKLADSLLAQPVGTEPGKVSGELLPKETGKAVYGSNSGGGEVASGNSTPRTPRTRDLAPAPAVGNSNSTLLENIVKFLGLPDMHSWLAEVLTPYDHLKQTAHQGLKSLCSTTLRGQELLKQAAVAVQVSVAKKLRALNVSPALLIAGLTFAATASVAGLLFTMLNNQRLQASLKQRDKELGRLMLKVLHMQDQFQHHFRHGPVLRHAAVLVPSVVNMGLP